MINLFLFFIFLNLFQNCPNEKFCASCVYYNDQNFCSMCYYSIYNPLMKRCVVPKKVINNCVEYTNYPLANCLRCDYGYFLNDSKQCAKCSIQDCAVCKDEICFSCFNGILPDENGQCQSEKIQKCPDNNCEICDSITSLCLECKQNFSLNKNLMCQLGPPNCLYLQEKEMISNEIELQIYYQNLKELQSNDQQGGQCKICKQGFFIDKQGMCYQKEGTKFLYLTSLSLEIVLIILLILPMFFFNDKNQRDTDSLNFEGYETRMFTFDNNQ